MPSPSVSRLLGLQALTHFVHLEARGGGAREERGSETSEKGAKEAAIVKRGRLRSGGVILNRPEGFRGEDCEVRGFGDEDEGGWGVVKGVGAKVRV